MGDEWRLELRGAPRLRAVAGVDRDLALVRKDAAFLALVALAGTQRSVRIATLLWPEDGERGALNNLRQRLFRLRRSTGALLVEMSDSLVLADDLALGEAANRDVAHEKAPMDQAKRFASLTEALERDS